MTPQRWAQIRQIFDGALERQNQDRGAYLRAVCGGDEQLRKEVESLLASHEGARNFMAAPIVDLNRAIPADVSSAEVPRIPRVGPYQLERRIGRGGMGSVWLASRADQEYQKKVAVKVVKRGMDSAEVLWRFRMERQLLAGLDHPNIARLIDGGTAQDGSPYLVMEYVEGTPIDQYCESHQSTITERLTLFRSVCSAVQYAHSNLVVHRDIKAGNILVTKDGVPKLLDFGVAKLIQNEFSAKEAAETRPEQRRITLEYASPEQVRGEAITTASDIYSLGVLLYKLLTGKLPFTSEDLRSRMAMQQAICEKEPPRPSSVVLSDEALAIPQPTQKINLEQEESRAKARRRLQRKLAGDLDVIILKALRKEPARRYVSAEQFSEDVRRYLEGKPVKARGDTLGYRALKFAQRNLAGVGLTAGVLALVLGGAIWFALGTRRSQAQLAAERERELELEPALIRAYDQLGDYRREMDMAREFLKAHPDRTDVRLELASAEIRIGDQDPAQAEALYADALTQFEAAAKQEPGNARRQTDVMMAERKLGLAQFGAGNLVAALTNFSRALQIAEALPPTPEARRASAACNFEMGEVLAANHEPLVAAGSLRKALELYRELAGAAEPALTNRTPAGFEEALAKVAADAPDDLRTEMNAEFQRMRK